MIASSLCPNINFLILFQRLLRQHAGLRDFNMMELLVIVFFSSLILTSAYQKFALKKAILDLPNARSSHHQPTPRGGGIVFVTVFYVFLTYLFAMQIVSQSLFFSLLGGIPIAIVGYCDDVYTIKIQWRILVHVAAAIWGILWLPISHD